MCTHTYGNIHKYTHHTHIHMQKTILKISLSVFTGLDYLLATTLMSFPSLCSLWKWTGVLHGTYAGSKATWQGHQRRIRAQTHQKKSFQADPLVWRDSQLKKNDPGELDRKGDPRVSTDTVEVTLCPPVEVTLCPQYTECVSVKNNK